MQLLKNFLSISVSLFLPCAHLIADEDSGTFKSIDSTAPILTSDLNEKLIRAIIKGDSIAVQDLIIAGANVNTNVPSDLKDVYDEDKHQTALMLAARHGNTNIMKALITAGANVNSIYGPWRTTALTSAAKQDHADIVELLIAAGANIESTDLFGATALINAASGKACELHRDTTIRAIKALIAAGANVNATDLIGGTALMEAAKHNNVHTVKALIAAGANMDAIDNSGKTALDWADNYQSFDAYRILRNLKNHQD